MAPVQAQPRCAFPFEAFRRRRFGHAAACPRCDAREVVRWGAFSGRRRYRCKVCQRTFSDFTATHLAYLKRLDDWLPHATCVRETLTVRATAARLGVHPSTAFRWRHRQLRALDAADCGRLDEVVALGETPLPHSEKGRRDLPRPPRRRGWPRNTAGAPSVWVLIARGASGRVASLAAGRRRPRADDYARLLLPRLGPRTRLLRRHRGFPGSEAFARAHGIPRVEAGVGEAQRGAVSGYVMRFRHWLRRFHGVASRHLVSYLAWHRFLEATRAFPPALSENHLLSASFP